LEGRWPRWLQEPTLPRRRGGREGRP